MQENYLQDLIKEVKKRDGGLILSLDGQPEVVVLAVEKYNELLRDASLNAKLPEDLNQTLTDQESLPDLFSSAKIVLVTGAAGYIGSHLAQALIKAGHQVIALDNLSSGKKENLPPEAIFYEGDVRDLNLLRDIFAQHKIDAVMHLAALIEVEESVREPQKYLDNNAFATAKLLQAMSEAGVKNLVFSSTCAVYEESGQEPLSEISRLGPKNPYGFSKLLAENIIKYYCEHLGFNAVVFRYFNACGFDDESQIRPTHESHLIAKVMQVAKGREAFLKINGVDYQTPDGSCVRDYVHVLDICGAHILALQALNAGKNLQIFNIGTGRGLSVLEVANQAAEILNKMIPMEIGRRRAGDAAMAVANNEKIKSELGFEPKHSDLATIIKTSWKQISRE